MAPSPRPGPHVHTPDGLRIATWDLGGDGPPLLATHGTGLHAWMWLGAAGELARGSHVWSLDLRGHGGSDPSPDGDYSDWTGFADDVLASVDALGLDRPAGVGHSMGAAALILAELRRPGTFESLWCWEPIIPPPGALAGADGPSLADLARRRRPGFASVEAAIDNYRGKPPFSGFAPGMLEAYVGHGFVPDGSGIRLVLPGEGEATCYEGAPLHGAWDRLGELHLPVTVAAAAGTAGPAQWVDAIASRIPGARVVRFAGLGHFGPVEDPVRVGAAAAEAVAAARSTGSVPPPR